MENLFFKSLRLSLLSGLMSTVMVLPSSQMYAQTVAMQDDKGSDMGLFTPIDAPNTPMGVARGIHPGRVTWAYDSKAAAWDGRTGLYSDADNNSQTRVNDLMEGVIINLTNQDNIKDAWNELFEVFNEKHGKGKTGYKPGEKIAIKINLNDNGGTNIIDATPQSVYALLHQLVDVMGVAQKDITIYDAQRRGISAVYKYVEQLYPDVVYQNWGGFVPGAVAYSAEITNPDAGAIARAAYEADYMINMALMKRHSTPTKDWKDGAGQTGITCTGKNQFGSLKNCSALHFSIRDWSAHRNGKNGSYNSIVDLMSNKYFGGNTLVYIVDAMYVNPKHNGQAVKFKNPPFNNGWTSSFLASNDQVAIESVVLDFINSELPLTAYADNFLHEAANISNPPSGTKYIGASEGSLGVHEHWNNPIDKQYTRNLGTGFGIELYQVPLDDKRGAIEYFYADAPAIYGKGKVTLGWNVSNAAEVYLNGKKVKNSQSMTVNNNATTDYALTAIDNNGREISQTLKVRNLKETTRMKPAKAKLDGTFLLNEKGQLVLSGERTKQSNTATWEINVPKTGDYYLVANYVGKDPVPAFIYIDGKLVTENFGFLSTVSENTPKEFYFPLHLTAGRHTLRYEMQGRRGNNINYLSLATENK